MDYELIVVDNASHDKTCVLIEEKFPEALLVRNPSNEGFAKANNLALQRARGDFILLINPDTEWKKGELREAIQFLIDHSEIEALGCRLMLEDGSWQKSHGNFPTLIREIKEVFYLPRVFPNSQQMRGVFAYQDNKEPMPVDWISGTFFLFRKEMLTEVGSFDEHYFLYYEDIDLSKRIREKGKEIYYYPEIEIIHFQRLGSVIDYGESPYIYYHKFFGFNFAEILRYILLLKSFLRIWFFLSLSFFSKRTVFREKLRSNTNTFKYHLVEAPRVLRSLKVGSKT
jgi:GT2 family glycosyltransferase